MTNIRAEHVAKTIAVARKNFLFAASVTGAKASAITYSLLETAKLNGHHPFEACCSAANRSRSMRSSDGSAQ
jgi:hypothetical protein